MSHKVNLWELITRKRNGQMGVGNWYLIDVLKWEVRKHGGSTMLLLQENTCSYCISMGNQLPQTPSVLIMLDKRRWLEKQILQRRQHCLCYRNFTKDGCATVQLINTQLKEQNTYLLRMITTQVQTIKFKIFDRHGGCTLIRI